MSTNIEVARQLPLQIPGIPADNLRFLVEPEVRMLGKPAFELIRYLADIFGIPSLQFAIYDPTSDYDHKSQSVFTVPRMMFDVIPNLHQLIVESTRVTVNPNETDGDSCMMIALLSKVWVNGQECHLPFFDIDFEQSRIDEMLDLLAKLKFPSGYILKSDRSFHFYSTEIMSIQSWKQFIRSLNTRFYGSVLLGTDYLDTCIARGHTALRPFAAPGTPKSTVPTVVQIFKRGYSD